MYPDNLISCSHRIGGQSKKLILSRNVDKESLETEFLIAFCRPTGNKWQLKTLFLVIFDLCSLIVKSIFDCCLSGVLFQASSQALTIV